MFNLELELSYIFTIFFITIGPLKVILPFHTITSEMESKPRKSLALNGALCALLILLGIMIISQTIINAWKISEMTIQITGGLLLFTFSSKMIANTYSPLAQKQQSEIYQNIKPSSPFPISGLTPIAIPTVISPVGILGAMAVMNISKNKWSAFAMVSIILLFILFLDVLAMIFAHAIMQRITPMVMSAIGWIMAILQAVLGIQLLINGIVHLMNQ